MTETPEQHDVRVRRARLEGVYNVLQDAQTHFVFRDQANAALHMAVPRWSPLTEAVMRAVRELATVLQLDDQVDDARGASDVTPVKVQG